MIVDCRWSHGPIDVCRVQYELQRRVLEQEEKNMVACHHALETDTDSLIATRSAAIGKPILPIEDGPTKRLENDVSTAICIVASLKACAKKKDLSKGIKLHANASDSGLLHTNVFVGSALMSMYIKCGALDKAQEVFDGLHIRNIVSWNALIAGYAQHGQSHKAIWWFDQMQINGFVPDKVSFACALKACGSLQDLDKGRALHSEIKMDHRLQRDTVVGTALIDMYGKCGELKSAQEVFDELPHCNLISWNSLLSGYVDNGQGKEALYFFEKMQDEGFSPDAISFVSALRACGNIGDSIKGQGLHARIMRERLLEKNSVLANAVIDMYAKCGDLSRAQEAFDQLSNKNLVSWTSLIAAYAQYGYGSQALSCYKRMQQEKVTPDAVTFICILTACGSIRDLEMGQEIHAQIKSNHLHKEHLTIANALISMYAKCGLLEKSKEVFNELLLPDVVSWNTLIVGYTDHGFGAEALNIFKQMQLKGTSPNGITYACILKACGMLGALEKGKDIHTEILNTNFLEKDVMVGSSLVDMYAKCGALEKARELFNMPLVRNLVSWNVLIAEYCQKEQYEQVLKCFLELQRDCLSPNAVTFSCILKACGYNGALHKGFQFHSEVVKYGIFDKDIVVAVELVLMYSRCGMLAEARDLFGKFHSRDEVLWSAMMVGYSQFGKDEVALRLFNPMLADNVMPSLATFTILLHACSHLGVLDKGEWLFKSLSEDYGIIPVLEHHSCLIDLFGRVGLIDQAVAMVELMPFSADLTVWLALSGACQRTGNKFIMCWIFENAVLCCAENASAYVHMLNHFTSEGWQEDDSSLLCANNVGMTLG